MDAALLAQFGQVALPFQRAARTGKRPQLLHANQFLQRAMHHGALGPLAGESQRGRDERLVDVDVGDARSLAWRLV